MRLDWGGWYTIGAAASRPPQHGGGSRRRRRGCHRHRCDGVVLAGIALSAVTIPFATSIVLVIGSAEAEPAQPRALIGGHVVATLAGAGNAPSDRAASLGGSRRGRSGDWCDCCY